MILGTAVTENDQIAKLGSAITQFHKLYRVSSTNGISSKLIKCIQKLDQMHWPEEFKLNHEAYQILRQCIAEDVLELPENSSVKSYATKIGLIGEHLKNLATQSINLDLLFVEEEEGMIPKTAITEILEMLQEIELEHPELGISVNKPNPAILKQVLKLLLQKIDDKWHLYSIEQRSDLKLVMPLIRSKAA